MSMISELVDSLRTEAKSMGTYGTSYMATLLMRSADTIVMLSEKAREPKRGEWIDAGADLDGTWYYRCSECSAEVENVEYPHCPYCLASMEGTDDDTD